MRIVFLGTPEFAVPTLNRLMVAGHQVLAVYTQPDRPQGRGQRVTFSPVKQAALNAGIPVEQPERIRRAEVVERLASHELDVMVVVGYGQIIPQNIIDLPRFGILNVHASLLPKYRGAAPIQWAIANGETVTGVTIMQIDAGLDTGAMLLRGETAIVPDETAVELSGRLAPMGAGLLVEALALLTASSITPVPQNDADATLAPILTKEDGLIDWTRTATEIYNRSRGFLPWPGVHTTFRDRRLHIWKAKPANPIGLGIPGSLSVVDRRLLVACGQRTALELEELQLEGRNKVKADAFLNGQRPADSDILGVINH